MKNVHPNDGCPMCRIDDKIVEWHLGKLNTPLHAYLGWTQEQYQEFVETGAIPE